ELGGELAQVLPAGDGDLVAGDRAGVFVGDVGYSKDDLRSKVAQRLVILQNAVRGQRRVSRGRYRARPAPLGGADPPSIPEGPEVRNPGPGNKPGRRRAIQCAGGGRTMRVAHFDCFSGISGDMTLGALIDAGVDAEAVRAAVASLGLPIALRI